MPSNYQGSETLTQWSPRLFPIPIEYPYLIKKYYGVDSTVNQSECYAYLNFDYLFSPALLPTAIINRDNQTYWDEIFPGLDRVQMMNYLRVVTVNVALTGFVTKRTVQELVIGYDDPFLTQMKYMDPAIGGNPSIPNNINYGQNQSYNENQNTQRVMYTGEGDYNKVRGYTSVFGFPNITVPVPFFDGNTSYISYVQPYINSTPIVGNDGAFGRPNLDRQNIDTDDIYVDVIFRGCTTEKSDISNDYADIRTERFVIPDNFLENKEKNPENANFHQDKYDGFLNFTSI